VKPVITDISSALDEPGSSVDVARDVDLEPMIGVGAEYTPTGPGHIEVSLMNSGDGIVAMGVVSGTFRTECSKCLEPFNLDITANVEALYLAEDQTDLIDADEDWEPLSGESVDLAPTLHSALQLSLPFAPLHDEDCAGICPGCGCDLNKESCDCSDEEDVSHPFAALKDLTLEDG